MNEDMKMPKHWEVKKLGEVAKVKGGKRLPKGDSYSETVTSLPYLRVTDFENQTININKLKYLKESTQKAIKNYTIAKDDVFISIAGTIGLTGTIPNKLDGSNLTENAAKITELKNCYNKYVSLFLSSILGQAQIKEFTKTTTQPKLSLYRIEQIEIPLPPLPEQQAIVSRIEELLSDLENGKKQLQTAQQQLKIYRQSLLKWAFEGKFTNKKVKEGELPKGWKIAVLNDVAEMCLGKMLDKNKNKGNYQYYLRNISVRWGSFDLDNLEQMKFEESEEERYSLKKNDLVICEGGEPGRCAIWKGTVPKMKIQKALHRVRVKNMLSAEFLFHFMYYSGICGLLEKYFTGTTIKHLTGGGLKKIELPLPPLEEQQLIVSELESKLTICDKIAETISQSLQQTETLRQSILKKAFEGKLVTVQSEKRKKLVPA